MSQRNRKPKTAAELMAELEADPSFVARRDAEERRRKVSESTLRAEEAPIVHDLRQAGYNVQSVWDLVNSSTPYSQAIEILLDHLRKDYHPRIREGIARALGVPEAKGKGAWRVLFDCLVSESEETTYGVKWALANSLSIIAKEANLDDLIGLVRDSRHGENRVPLVECLSRFRLPHVVQVLEELANDEAVAVEANKVLRILREV